MDPLKKKKKKLDLDLGLNMPNQELPPPPQPLIQQSYAQPLQDMQPIYYDPNKRLDMSQYAPDYSSVNMLAPPPNYGNPGNFGGGNFGGGGGSTPYPSNPNPINYGGGFKFDKFGNFIQDQAQQPAQQPAPTTTEPADIPKEEETKEDGTKEEEKPFDSKPYDFGKQSQLQDVNTNASSGSGGNDWWKWGLGAAALGGAALLGGKGIKSAGKMLNDVDSIGKGIGNYYAKTGAKTADALALNPGPTAGAKMLEGSGDIFAKGGPSNPIITPPPPAKPGLTALNPAPNANVPLLEGSGDIFASGSTNPIIMRPPPKIVDPYARTTGPLAATGTGNYYTGLGGIGANPKQLGNATRSFNTGSNIDPNFVKPINPLPGVTTGSNIDLNAKSPTKQFTYGEGNKTVKDALAKPKPVGDAVSDARKTINDSKFVSIADARKALGNKVPAGYKLVKKGGKVELVKLGAK